jgi:hypothetical protein
MTRRAHLFSIASIFYLSACGPMQEPNATDDAPATSCATKRGLSVPPFLCAIGKQHDPLVAAGYLDVTLYDGWNGHRVDKTGVADSTAALQQAIDDARDYALVTYLPSGTYSVSNTLVGQSSDASGRNISCLDHFRIGTPFSYPRSPSLAGPPNGPRPEIVLRDRATGFGDATRPRPVVHFLLVDKYAKNWRGDAPCLLWAVLRDVDIRVGSGNAGAVGVQFEAAQFSYIENVKVDATGGYAGMQGVPSTDTVVNVEVDGGRYGIITDTCCGITLAGAVLKNQTVAALNLSNFMSTVIVGFDIEVPSGSAIINPTFISQTSQVALFDGRISIAGGTSPAIDNSNGHDLYVSNVYVETPGSLIRSGSDPAIASGPGFDLVHEYAYTNPKPYTQSGVTTHSTNLIDGTKGQAEIANVQHNAGAPPADLVSRHLPGSLPAFTDPHVLDATSIGAKGDGVTDDTAAIQRAIDEADSVFLPRGDYLISSTIHLRANTRLFGVPSVRTRIHGMRTWDPAGKFTPLLATVDSATARTHLGDIELDLPDTSHAQTYLYGVDWRAGRSSIARQIAVQLPWQNNIWDTADRHLVHIAGHGGGKWYGLQIGEEIPARTHSPGFRTLLVEGTSAPLTFYQPNAEHARSASQLEFDWASNFRILGIKTEATTIAELKNAKNALIAGHAGHDGLDSGDVSFRVEDSNDVVMPAIALWVGQAYAAGAFNIGVTNNGSKLSGVPADTQVSLFKVGTFDARAFPHCGDGVCDGAESKTSCPGDC